MGKLGSYYSMGKRGSYYSVGELGSYNSMGERITFVHQYLTEAIERALVLGCTSALHL